MSKPSLTMYEVEYLLTRHQNVKVTLDGHSCVIKPRWRRFLVYLYDYDARCWWEHDVRTVETIDKVLDVVKGWLRIDGSTRGR